MSTLRDIPELFGPWRSPLAGADSAGAGCAADAAGAAPDRHSGIPPPGAREPGGAGVAGVSGGASFAIRAFAGRLSVGAFVSDAIVARRAIRRGHHAARGGAVPGGRAVARFRALAVLPPDRRPAIAQRAASRIVCQQLFARRGDCRRAAGGVEHQSRATWWHYCRSGPARFAPAFFPACFPDRSTWTKWITCSATVCMRAFPMAGISTSSD